MFRSTPLLFVSLFSACSAPTFDHFLIQTGCDVQQTLLALDEVTTIGLSAQDLIDRVEGQHVAQAAWSHDETEIVDVVIDVAWTGADPILHDRSPTSSSQTGGAEVCDDFISLPVTLLVTTADGSFSLSASEAWVNASTTTEASVQVEWALEDVGGSWIPRPEDTWNWDTASLALDTTWTDEDGLLGGISLLSEGNDGEIAPATATSLLAWPGM